MSPADTRFKAWCTAFCHRQRRDDGCRQSELSNKSVFNSKQTGLRAEASEIGAVDTESESDHIGVMNTNIRVKTAQAAEVAGVGYEGFRSWLKRGLLKDNGALPKFYAVDAPAEVSDAKRWRWSAFGFVDLCSFRLTKLLLDAGLSWEVVSTAVSDDDVWRRHRSDQPDKRFLAVFPKTLQYTLYSAETLADDLNKGIIESSWMMVIDLRQVRRDVVCRVRAIALRTLAGDVKRTSHFFARSGRNMLSTDETITHQKEIEALADKVTALAIAAEQGEDSYPQFEAILVQLHDLGKFPDNADVSAVAHAFAD